MLEVKIFIVKLFSVDGLAASAIEAVWNNQYKSSKK